MYVCGLTCHINLDDKSLVVTSLTLCWEVLLAASYGCVACVGWEVANLPGSS